MTLVLCGFLCAGKTVLGKALSQKLNLPFYDTDRLLSEKCGGTKSNTSIWNEVGEKKFREMETEAILSIPKQNCILATGGGALLKEENRVLLKTLGNLVYIKVSIEKLYNRMLKRGMPAFLDQENPKKHFTALASERFSLFEKYCQFVLDTEQLDFEQVLKNLEQLYGQQ